MESKSAVGTLWNPKTGVRNVISVLPVVEQREAGDEPAPGPETAWTSTDCSVIRPDDAMVTAFSLHGTMGGERSKLDARREAGARRCQGWKSARDFRCTGAPGLATRWTALSDRTPRL